MTTPSTDRSTAAQPGARRPNLVLIMTDDQGFGDLQSYGAPLLKTPNIDGLGERGIRFTQHYAGSPLCTPSRAALLSGAWPPRVNMPNVLNPRQSHGLSRHENLLSDYLHDAGYATAIFGKWHLGDPAADPSYHPMRHGFDTWYGIPYSNDYPTIPLYDEYDVVDEIVYPGSLGQDAGNGDEQNWLNKSIFERAIGWIGARDSTQPFFAYIAASQPHEPVASEFEGSAGGPHGSTIEEMDGLVGTIVETLEALGVRDDTCLVFTSDNGPWWVGDTAGLAGRKGETYEGGIRVPFVLEWPRVTQGSAGRVYEQPTSHIDVLPTFCAAAGVPVDAGRTIDGRNITPVLEGSNVADPLDIAYYQGNTLNALRHGNWKLHVQRVSNVSRHTGRLDWSASEGLPHLFDLANDPNECYDVSARHPHIAAEMQERLAAFDAALKSDLEHHYGAGSPWTLVDVTAEGRVTGASTHLAVRVRNISDGPIDLTIDTPYGSRSFTGVRPGGSGYQSFNVRAPRMPAGSVTVTVAGMRPVVTRYEALEPSTSP
jgi:arylsulfatase A